MKIRFAKNIAIIVLEHDDLYQLSFQKREEIFDKVEQLIQSDTLSTTYKIHLFVDEEPAVINANNRKFKLVDKFRVYGKKLKIHSFYKGTVIPGADTLWFQEFAIDSNTFITVLKRKGKIEICEARWEGMV